MGRKVFQIGFILLVMAAFGTVFNHYLKNKVSDHNNYLSYIESFPKTRVSIIDPIVIKLPRAFDKSDYVLNTPLEESIIQFDPEVEGTVYWSDQRTLVFYPDNPLVSNSEYKVIVDINKIFKLPSKVKDFRFKLNTYKQVLFVNTGNFIAMDSTLEVQNYNGSIVFNDFIDFDYVNELFKAEQDGKRLNISFKPGKSKGAFLFTIENIKRKNIADTLTISWDGKPIGVALKGYKELIIPSLNYFKVNEIELKEDSIVTLKIGFSDPIAFNQSFDSLIDIKGATVKNYSYNGSYLTIDFDETFVQKIHLNISKKLTNCIGKNLQTGVSKIVNIEKDVPALRIFDSTFIISEFSDNFHWEFEALKLKAVNVQIYKIFANNVLQFLQINDFQGVNQIERVGSIVYQKTLTLSEQLQYNPEKWTKYQININDFEPEEGCLYSVLVSFDSHQNAMPCNNEPPKNITWSNFLDDYYEVKGDSINDPCSKQFYGFRRGIHHNLYYTKLGIMTKQIGNDSLYVWVTDINNTMPGKNVSIKVLNYQQQLIANGESDNNGMVRFKLGELPSFIIAEQGSNTTYLKLKKTNTQKEINEEALFIKKRKYWSPGDTINIGFIHNSIIEPLPNSLLTFNMLSPDKKKVYTELKLANYNNQYIFKYYIPKGGSIGEYMAEISFGDMVFSETFLVLPKHSDRIKIGLKLIKETDTYFEYELSVDNAVSFAGKLNYHVEFNSVYKKDLLNEYKHYRFGNADKQEKVASFSGTINEIGKAFIRIPKTNRNSEFKVSHSFYCRVINENMGFNEYSQSFNHFLKKSLIGINTNNQNRDRNVFYCDSSINYSFVLLDKNYVSVKRKTNAEILLYKYEREGVYNLLNSELVQFKYGICNWSTIFNFPNKGTYKLEIQTLNGSAVASHLFDVEWPSLYKIQEDNKLVRFSLQTDKDTVTIADSLGINLQAEHSGNILITVENHNGVNFNKRYSVKKGENNIKLPVYKSFYPNFILHSYYHSENSTPVITKSTIQVKQKVEGLNPIVYGLNEVEAENNISVTVKEQSNYPLNYILTVSPEKVTDNSMAIDSYINSIYGFYNSTIDVYGNYVVSNSNFPIQEIKANRKSLTKRNPFAPFDIQLGPFHISAGESKTHEIKMPQYIGDVNVSIIASSVNNQEVKEVVHKVSVNKSFMILTSTPDNISPDEEFYLPINIFSSRKEKREANIELANNVELSVLDDFEKKIMVNYIETDTTSFRLKSKRRTGLGGIDIIANDSNLVESRSIEIPIRSNNILVNKWVEKQLEPEEIWQTRYTPIGVKGTNYSAIEYSENSNIHLNQLILKLLNNSHPDIEHLISASFPFMFVRYLTDIETELETILNRKIQSALNELIYYQLPSGGFSYWKNTTDEQNWCGTYAGFFMIEARKQGFEINQAVYNKWLRYQRRKCLTWSFTDENTDLEQAFGLYTLALAKKPDLNSMLKLKNKMLSNVAAKMLSMAFSVIEEQKSATQVVSKSYNDFIYLNDKTFGNPLRNTAISLISYGYINNKLITDSVKYELEKMIVNADYQSLQAISFSIIGLAKYYRQDIKQLDKEIEYTVNRGKQSLHSSTRPYGIVQIPIDFTLAKTIDITNNTESKINVSVDYSGRPDKITAAKNSNYINGRLKFINSSGKQVNKGHVNINGQLNADINIWPSRNNLYTNYMVLVFPIANCFDYLSFSNLNNEHIHHIHQYENKVYYYFTLPDQGIHISIPLTTTHKGKFHQPPVQVYSLYNPMVKTVLIGNNFLVK